MPKTKTTVAIKTYEEACAIKKLDAKAILPDVSNFPGKHQASILAFAQLIIIASVLNDGWEPDWNNDDQYKYYPWFDLEEDKTVNPTGFRFYVSYYDITDTDASSGSRLCYKTRELSDYAGKQFADIYREMMVIPK